MDTGTSVVDAPALDDRLFDDLLHDERAPDGHGAPDGRAPRGRGELGGVGVTSSEQAVFFERCAWSIVWLGVLVNACALWESWWSWPLVDALAPALVAVALAGSILCWCGRTPRSWWHQGMAVVSVLTSVVAQQALNVHARIYYQTDAAALDHVAARLLASGQNPYAKSLASAGLLLKNPTDFWTYTVTGGHVVNLSYPAGSALLYAPAFVLGFHHEVVDWMDLYFWIAGAVMLFLLVPRSFRWLSALVVLSGFFTYFSNGGTDAAFIPFAMIAVWRWDRYGGERDAGIARWVGPIALGIACSVKQLPWFFVPFLVVGIYVETRRAGRSPGRIVSRYLAVTVATFAAVNLPFIVWGPSAWWHGAVTPVAQPLIAGGQGLVSLALHGLTGGVDLGLLTAATGLALLCVVAAFAGWYRQLKRIWLLLIPVVFFFSTRSLSSYFLDLFPVALVAMVTIGPPELPIGRRGLGSLEWARRRRAPEHLGRRGHLSRWGSAGWTRVAAMALAVATAATAALSFTGAPLGLSLRSASIGSHQGILRSVTVTVANRTARTVVPHFMVDAGNARPTGFWTTAGRRPVVIGPHESRTVTLFPPSTTYLPPEASDYVVQAYSANPDALSTTREIWRNYTPPPTSAHG